MRYPPFLSQNHPFIEAYLGEAMFLAHFGVRFRQQHETLRPNVNRLVGLLFESSCDCWNQLPQKEKFRRFALITELSFATSALRSLAHLLDFSIPLDLRPYADQHLFY